MYVSAEGLFSKYNNEHTISILLKLCLMISDILLLETVMQRFVDKGRQGIVNLDSTFFL